MGEAKRRGSYECRKVLAIEKAEAEAKARAIERCKARAAMSPEQKAREKKAKMFYCATLGMLAAKGIL